MRTRRRRQPKPAPKIIPELVASGVGTPERLQHGDVIERQKHVMFDDRGEFAQPFRNIDILERWSRMNPPKITVEMRTAGDTFRQMFRHARLDTLHATPLIPPVDNRARDPYEDRDEAHKFISRALEALGGTNSPCGSCAWYVLGEGYTIRHWGQKFGYHGRLISEEAASGILVAALGVLANLKKNG